MAQVNLFLGGKTSGRVGNIIFYQRNGKTYMRSAPIQVKNPKSEGQMIQRAKLTLANLYLRPILFLINIGWIEMSKGKSQFNAAVSYLIKNVCIETPEGVALDRSRIMHAHGSLMRPDNLRAEMKKGQHLIYRWVNNSYYLNALPDDIFCYVCANLDNHKTDLDVTNRTREDGSYLHSFPKDWKGTRVAIYGFFINEEQRLGSDDSFLGIMKVE